MQSIVACHTPDMSENAHRRSKDDDHEQDRLLPIANVARIMKRGLPENAKIAKEAKECIQECVSEFISFVTSEGKESFDDVYGRMAYVYKRRGQYQLMNNHCYLNWSY